MKKETDPYIRGEQDFDKGIYECPYPLNSKEEKQWKKAQFNKAYASAIAKSIYDSE